MSAPRFSIEEVVAVVSNLEGETIRSLTGRSSHVVKSVDKASLTYEIEYESGNRKTIKVEELYTLYAHLYAHNKLTNEYMLENHEEVLGWKHWHAPGSAMLAILPHIDDKIRYEGANLYL